jgi:adenosylmethionine-8-amino-7-oxononanoate aminotransferase
VVVLMPPLTISAKEVERIVDVLVAAVDSVAGRG